MSSNHVLWVHEQQEEHEELVEKTRIHTERLRIAEEKQRMVHAHVEAEKKRIAAEEAERNEQRRLKELAAKKIPPLSPIQQQTVQQPAPAAQPTASTTPTTKSSTTQPIAQEQKSALPAVNGKTATKSLFSAATAAASTSATAPAQAAPVASKPAPAPAPVKQDPKRERALQIHKNLKGLRNSVSNVQAGQNPALKNTVGDMRREIRKCVGQLSFNKANNNSIVSSCEADTILV